MILEFNSHSLSDSRLGLLGLNSDLFNDDTGSMRSTLEGLSPLGDLICLFEVVFSQQ